MKNNQGSLFIVLLPLILTVMFVGLTALYIYNYHDKTQTACQHHLLRSQEILAEALTDLLNLNPEAQSLRAQEIGTRAELAAAIPFPPVYAAVQARYLVILSNQANLHYQQNRIIAQGQLRALVETSKLRQEFRGYSAIFSRNKNLGPTLAAPKLSIRAIPPSTLAPSYITAPFFSQAQKLTARWTIPMSNLLPKALAKIFKPSKRFKLQCSATIEKRGLKWQSLLTKDRS